MIIVSVENISIKKIVVHILDNNLQMPVFSEVESQLDDDIIEFVGRHIEKIVDDDSLKSATFIEEDNKVRSICEKISKENEFFLKGTIDMGDVLFKIMYENVEIPPADVIFILFDIDSVMYLGILKLNYKHSYIHHIETTESGIINSIVKQKTTLPSIGQRVDECAIINLEDFSLNLYEKKYNINDEKIYYFSSMFLKCSSQISLNEKVKIFTKATKKFSETYFDEDPVIHAEIKKAVVESIEENEAIDVEEVAKSVFSQNPQLKQEYIEHVEKAGIKEKSIPIDNEKIVDKNFRKQKIKTDTGVEISLPVEYYGNNDKIEFITNADGTISILIKDIGKITHNK
ncbi:nucleoid-associated protein [Proteiniborus sp. MB09-C3]|nr:nucleoid-associated protein [Proteiniborus sp. MB09-C3]WIV11714.1 nucleoid-associated protein [Proteiniborus sp. MB09-C3]